VTAAWWKSNYRGEGETWELMVEIESMSFKITRESVPTRGSKGKLLEWKLIFAEKRHRNGKER
jgi:hypothetical protein